MTIKVKQYKSEHTVGVKVDAATKHGQFTIKTGTLEAQIRNKLYGAK